MISIDDVSVSFPDGEQTIAVLDHARLSVSAGEVVTIAGRSGTGKSTLLAVAGLLRSPDSGEVMIAGTPTSGLAQGRRTTLRRREIGIIYQSAELFPSLTAVQQLELVAHIAGDLDDKTRQRARDLLTEVGLSRRLDNHPSKLSGGERQRVGIARALMNTPSVLLADEPTASLDPQRGREVMELITSEARERDLACVVVSHDPTHADLCDRSLRLEGGELTEIS